MVAVLETLLVGITWSCPERFEAVLGQVAATAEAFVWFGVIEDVEFVEEEFGTRALVPCAATALQGEEDRPAVWLPVEVPEPPGGDVPQPIVRELSGFEQLDDESV